MLTLIFVVVVVVVDVDRKFATLNYCLYVDGKKSQSNTDTVIMSEHNTT